MKRGHFDRPLVFLLALLVVGGAMIFASAAFGLLARGATHMSSVVFNHLVLGLGLGLVALVIGATVDYRRWKQFAPYLFGLALVATASVFIPAIGLEHGGGKRWIEILGMSFQPSEGLKVAAVIMAAAFFAAIRNKTTTFTYGLGGFASILALPVLILIMQPDIGTLSIVCIGVGSVFFAAGASWKQIATVVVVGLLALTMLTLVRPYMRDRVMTFLNPAQGQQAESYQIRQSLIAIGSGGFLGRGFGQGIQKFTYLPEPMGDSIFAVAGEEIGFVGAVVIVLLFLGFALRGYSVAAHAPDLFGSLLSVGLSTYLTAEAFINIAAMLGVAPLTGIPLTFVSQGGSAMLTSLAAAGILLNISRHRGKKAF
jgi:cell division protein FtsW